MEGFGQFGPILVRPGHQISGTFTLNKITNLDRNTRPCISDENYSYNQCLRKYAVKVSSCNIDLPQKQYNCTENGLKLLFRTLTELRSRTKTNITKTTGCLPKCVINKYVFDQKENEIVTWRKDWISSFYLTSETTTYQTSLESYSYEIQVIDCHKCVFKMMSVGCCWCNWWIPWIVSGMVCHVNTHSCSNVVQTDYP